MARRTRRQPEPGKYEDPLSNYDEPRYDDGLERSLREDQTAKVINCKPFTPVGDNLTVKDAIALMAKEDIACLVMVEDNKPIGIFTERDAQNAVAPNYAELADKPLSSVMTKDPVVLQETDPPARVVNLMTSGMFRHVPIVDVDGKLVGVVGPRRLTSYLKHYFADVASG